MAESQQWGIGSGSLPLSLSLSRALVEYMAQRRICSICKCCHINGDLHMDAANARATTAMTRALWRHLLYRHACIFCVHTCSAESSRFPCSETAAPLKVRCSHRCSARQRFIYTRTRIYICSARISNRPKALRLIPRQRCSASLPFGCAAFGARFCRCCFWPVLISRGLYCPRSRGFAPRGDYSD